MSPRRSATETQATRARILDRAAEIASVEGLDGITIGRLAAEMGMSKSGTHKHFGSKEALQIATLDSAFADFWHQVVEPVPAEPSGLHRLNALCANSVDYLETPRLPGGCLLTGTLSEYDSRPGQIRDAIAQLQSRWHDQLRTNLTAAVHEGELPAEFDVEQALFEIVAAGLALNAAVQLNHDAAAPSRARLAIGRALNQS